jgi:hypothetical protein
MVSCGQCESRRAIDAALMRGNHIAGDCWCTPPSWRLKLTLIGVVGVLVVLLWTIQRWFGGGA